jgi:hypothetical protein
LILEEINGRLDLDEADAEHGSGELRIELNNDQNRGRRRPNP